MEGANDPPPYIHSPKKPRPNRSKNHQMSWLLTQHPQLAKNYGESSHQTPDILHETQEIFPNFVRNMTLLKNLFSSQL